jgi:hypothetical protein
MLLCSIAGAMISSDAGAMISSKCHDGHISAWRANFEQ